MITARIAGGPTLGRRRMMAIVLTALVHLLAMLVLLLPDNLAVFVRPRSALITFDVVNDGAAKPAVRRAPQPRKVVPPLPAVFTAPPLPIDVPRLSPVVATTLEQAEAQAAVGGCDLTTPVQVALQASSAVQSALLRIPRQRRSVANAIALWDRQWVPSDAMLDAQTLDTIRMTITTTVAEASPECRTAQQAGPRLIYVAGQRETTVLALGSGQWTWQQVADSAQVDLALGPDGAPVNSNVRPVTSPPSAVPHP